MNKYYALVAALGFAVSGAAYAQTASVPAGVVQKTVNGNGPAILVPETGHVVAAGSQAVVNGQQKVQAVSINGVATAATPGALGNDGLPSIANAQVGNVAGLTAYCVHKKLVHGTAPRVASRKLAHRPDVIADQYYSLGGRGLLQTATNTPFDISSLPKDKKVLLCVSLVQKAQGL
ncbi:DUF2501 domain-containing protein [Swingsia samuiensis]|nr:DUF2501 domain-containing protein [Swingsia samuiensis]